MFKSIIFIIFITTNFLFAEDESLKKVSLQLHWKYQFEFAGFIAAKEKGFYKDVGLDVELREYNFGENIIKDVISQKATYGVYNSNILIEYIKNTPIKLLSSYFKRSALVLITKPNIKYPQDLLGKKIMAAGKNDFNLNFNYILSLQNIKVDDLNFVPHSFDVKDFALGKVDAMTAFISDQPYKLDKLGIDYNIIDPSNYGIFNLQLELFTSQDEANKNSEQTEKFKEATLKGWEYALNHPDKIIEIILEKYNTQNLTEDFLKNEAFYTQRLILPKMYQLGSIDEMFLFRQIDILYKNTKFSFDEKKDVIDNFIFYTKEELEEKEIENNYKLLKKLTPFLLIIILIIFYRQWLLNKYNKNLQKEVEKKTKEYKIKNKELQNSNQNFIDLLDTAIEAILIFDKDNNLVRLNHSGEQMFDYNFEDLKTPLNITDFIQKEFIDEIVEKLKENSLKPFEISLLKDKNTPFPALVSGRNIIKEKQKFTILTVVDLTQIKRKDEFLQQQAKLAQMGELLSMIAHQWRQPLTAISAASETLKLKAILNNIDAKSVEEATTDIYKYTCHLNETINDFRNFYTTNKVLEDTTLNHMVEKSLHIIEDSIKYRDIEIIKELESTTIFRTYKSEITQVILSLLQNAEDVLVENKPSNPCIKIKTYEDNNFIYLEIIDNAGGIPKDIVNKIFDPYFSTKPEKNGTGLGLYFSKQIIENNCNGSLILKENSKETIFSIIFKK